MATLDRRGIGDIGLIKIDVEGAELAVVRGAQRTIDALRPVLLVEILADIVGAPRLAETVSHILALGYSGTFAWCGREHEFSAFDPQTHQLAAMAQDVLRDCASNFIFRPNPA